MDLKGIDAVVSSVCGVFGGRTHAMCSGELRQVRLVLLQVVQTVDVLYVHLQLPEVLRQDAGTGVQDAPQVWFGQLLPLVQSHRA